MTEYEAVIGLEVHAELSTRSKIYCSCRNEFGLKPNSAICPVCMGLPGTLPVLNKEVVEYAAKMGIAMNCKINTISYQDRKNYFYPDLPKAYQISQSEKPLCENGLFDILVDGKIRQVRINRIHIEEDAGKLLHESSYNGSLVDLNRCGVPLIEIVSEPDLRSSSETKAYLDAVKMTLLYLGISDCKMQEGSLRCDVNVSIRKKGCETLGTRCEMKNVNSFSGAVRGIEYEIKRQIEILKSGGTIVQETRRWDDAKGRSFLMRTKENAQDYRYFPEPDLQGIEIKEEKLYELRESIPELPISKILRYMTEYGFTETDARLITEEPERAYLLDACVELGSKPKSVCSLILTDIAKFKNDTGRSISETGLTPEKLSALIRVMERGEVSSTAGKKVLSVVMETGEEPSITIERLGLSQNSDENELRILAEEVLDQNEKSVQDYKNGKKNVLGYLIGQCMQRSNGRANPVMVNRIVNELLK